ncbi:MAG: hypothetical protein A2675_03270 [Candidatus Yonathbacteria bacterium RIFCSPHIGHO2_01_FULL_51_10]|uniref:Uncharacterized protein n=1 Tax=Candidatus Yonathbacteria bacterium RIFCSPHIGHO2_01_FULL_51_10 TaxID=1802723 RepID=A0A1G2S8Z0_9BACT|nr:MAG: hypothetical protein A2675_03270 [Candidatus Yonathbacteria bacterium RIFCSPHIGHO2_01_FULL_51_10]
MTATTVLRTAITAALTAATRVRRPVATAVVAEAGEVATKRFKAISNKTLVLRCRGRFLKNSTLFLGEF